MLSEETLIKVIVSLVEHMERIANNQEKVISILNEMKEKKTNNDICGVSF